MDIRDTGIREHLFRGDSPSYLKNEKDDNLIDCYHGINPYGPAPEVEEALKKHDNDKLKLHQYPIHRKSELVEALTDRWMRDTGEDFEGRIRVASGAKNVLENVNGMLLDRGDTVVGLAPQYSNYVRMVEAQGGEYDPVRLKPDEGMQFSATRLINRIEERKPELVYIDNPNNPTGQFIRRKTISEIAEVAEKSGTIVMVDEAYGGFLDRGRSAATLTDYRDNLIVVRSFSKAHGLAGVRSGYAVISEKLVEFYDKVRTPYKMSTLAIELSKTALDNEYHLDETRKKMETGKKRIMDSVDCEIMETHEGSPIMTLRDREFEDLWGELKKAGVLTNNGENFQGLDSSFVRVRIPRNAGQFIMAYNKLKNQETVETKTWERNR